MKTLLKNLFIYIHTYTHTHTHNVPKLQPQQKVCLIFGIREYRRSLTQNHIMELILSFSQSIRQYYIPKEIHLVY